MDKLIHTAKDLLDKDEGKEQSQSQGYSQPGYDQSSLAGANKPAGGLASFLGDMDFNDAKEEATKQAGPSGSRDLFSSILNIVGQKQHKIADEDVDEEDAIKKHKKTYDDDDDDNDESSLGTAAAIQALKLFNKGETGENQSQSAFLGLAMSEASKLFDQKSSQGKLSSSASKQGTIQQAAEMALKLFLKSKGEQQGGGLMSLASKFIK